jgi:dTMP kinase
MTTAKFYGAGFPYNPLKEYPGKLVVLEGTDGVGRSTQTMMLRQWLEKEGYAVSDTGLRRSPMTQPGLDQPVDHEPFLRHRFRRSTRKSNHPGVKGRIPGPV